MVAIMTRNLGAGRRARAASRSAATGSWPVARGPGAWQDCNGDGQVCVCARARRRCAASVYSVGA